MRRTRRRRRTLKKLAAKAVCLATGEDFTLFLPWVNTPMMNMFVERMGAALGGRPSLPVMDQAGWHRSRDLEMPLDIEPAHLPPHSLELNPVERLWDWLKRNTIRNQFFQAIDEVMDSVGDCMRNATSPYLKSMCGCNYLLQLKWEMV